MNKTIISWTNVTWNPTHGCTRVSEGCRNCYAESLSLRYGHTQNPWTKQHEKENVLLKPHKLREPYLLKEPSRIFVNSMSDLFHPLIPVDYRKKIFAVMRDLPQHTFQILTKRPEIAAAWPKDEWSPNIWMGASVEDRRALARIESLRQCPAHTRFISAEPLIESWPELVDLSGIDWLIVGGESGKDFRPMPHSWARHIRDLCLAQGVAFFFKQSSARVTERGTSLKHDNGQFYTWEQFPGQMTKPSISNSHKFTHE